ncbi:MAG: GNAT family N-acetyltransferase, partial [Clostridiales bacterium]|nr:GNAT family N-acetyltransferase [Clostridiales bacterium]
MENLVVKKAEKIDIDTIFELINGLAKYEKRPWDMTGTKEELLYWLFERQIATTLLA